MKEVYNKTATEADDWDSVKKDMREWYKKHGEMSFRTTTARDKEDPFIIELAQKYADHQPPLLDGLDEDGVIQTLRMVLRRVCYNLRRESESPTARGRPSSPGQDFDGSSSSTSSSAPEPPPLKKKRRRKPAEKAVNLQGVKLNVRCNGRIAKLFLADIAGSSCPPVPLQHAASQITLERFAQCCKEDLEVEDLQVAIQYKYQGSGYTTTIKTDRQLHGALSDVIDGGLTDHVFDFLQIDPNSGQHRSKQTAGAVGVVESPNSNYRAETEAKLSDPPDHQHQQRSRGVSANFESCSTYSSHGFAGGKFGGTVLSRRSLLHRRQLFSRRSIVLFSGIIIRLRQILLRKLVLRIGLALSSRRREGTAIGIALLHLSTSTCQTQQP